MFDHVHVLIIDDNSSDASVLQKLLSRMEISYDVIFDTRTLEENLSHLKQPDVVFLDLEIPGLNGYEVLNVLRATPAYAGVPIVAYTANSAEMANCRQAGFHSFLGKPLRSTSFSEQLERILNNEPVWEVR